MIAKLLLVVVEAPDAETLDHMIDQLARSACDVSNSMDEDDCSIMIEEAAFNLLPSPRGETL